MKAKIKKQFCDVPSCFQKAICAWQPKNRADKKLWICKKHRDESHDILWKLVGLPKPEKVHRPKLVVSNHKPKREGKAAWQKILDNWFAKGKYPVSAFMNLKRWEYWISIGGKKPEGGNRKFKKEEVPVHPLLTHKMNKHKKTKVRRKK